MTIFDVLLRLTEHPPESWRPDDNPQHPKAITGTIVHLGVYANPQWGQSPSLTIVTTGGKAWRWLALHTVPKDELGWEAVASETKAGRYTAASPRIGDPIAVAYRGRAQGAGGEYEDWRVAFVHAEHAHLFEVSGQVAPSPLDGRSEKGDGLPSDRGASRTTAGPPTSSGGGSERAAVGPRVAGTDEQPAGENRSTPAPSDDDWHGPFCGTCQKPIRGKAKLAHGIKYHDDCDPEEPF